jgi:hypothetical protein
MKRELQLAGTGPLQPVWIAERWYKGLIDKPNGSIKRSFKIYLKINPAAALGASLGFNF